MTNVNDELAAAQTRQTKLRGDTAIATQAKAAAVAALDAAMASPATKPNDITPLKTSIAAARNAVELAAAREAKGAAEVARLATAAAEAREADAAAEKVRERQAAIEQAAVVNAAVETARAELAKLTNMAGVHPVGLEIAVLKLNRSFSDPVARCVCHDIAAAVGLPSPNDAQRRAVAISQAKANRIATAEIVKMAAATQRGAQMREALSGPGLPQRGVLVQDRGNVLN